MFSDQRKYTKEETNTHGHYNTSRENYEKHLIHNIIFDLHTRRALAHGSANARLFF